MANKYLVGDFVTFYESYELGHTSLPIKFLKALDEWYDNQISEIISNKYYIFEDIDGSFPIDVISGYSPDYIKGQDGINDISREEDTDG